VQDPNLVCATPEDYRNFIVGSKAEFGCAKPIHADLQTGWFSDRTAAYLSSGRPAVVEDTGFSGKLETGEGLMTFTDMDSAIACLDAIASDPVRHGRCAREWSEAYLSADKALRPILAEM
jgi:hypothetical protein